MTPFEKIAEREIPIYTNEKPGPNGQVDCLRKVLAKKQLRYIMVMKLKRQHESTKKGVQGRNPIYNRKARGRESQVSKMRILQQDHCRSGRSGNGAGACSVRALWRKEQN